MWIGVGCGKEQGSVFASVEFADPAPNVPGHLVIFGSSAERTAREIIYVGVPDPNAQPLEVIGKERVAGVVGDLYSVPESSSSAFGGHLAAVWTLQGHIYAVGVHGTGRASVELNRRVLNGIRMVQP